MKKEKFVCPVCGYDKLDEPAYDEELVPSFETCPCCHREFGFDDYPFETARRKWTHSFLANVLFWKKKKQLANLENPQVKNMIKLVDESYKNNIK